MANLSDPRVISLKGFLFLLLGLLASALLVAQLPDLRYAFLLAVAVWGYCRAYYFAFYVIEHYVDPDFRFAGLFHFARYALLGHSPDRKERR
ncbi:hypothetical protein SH467x_001118 [Pirellulaceae bacterium SH467]